MIRTNEINDSSNVLPSRLHETAPLSDSISQGEPLTRFVTDKDHLDKPPRYVFWRAFRPKPAERELSIARIADLTAQEIWQLGDALAGTPSGRLVFGRADFSLTSVRAARINGVSLDAVPDPPPPRHALIVGWPEDGNARRALAMLLAAGANQHVR